MTRALATSMALAVLATVAQTSAAGSFLDPPAPAEKRPARWGLSANVGAGSIGGDFGEVLKKPISGELNLFRAQGPWRFGFGVSFGSYGMKAPYEAEPEWGFLRTYLSATRMLKTQGTFQPYLQVRGGLARLHARSELFNLNPLPPDFVVGDSTTKAHNGFSVELVPGVEWNVSHKLAIDLSASLGYTSVDEVDFAPVQHAPASSGTPFEVRLGLRWHPDDGYPSGVRSGGPASSRDAWGVGHNHGWAAAEVLAINVVSGDFNEYVRNGNFNQISPRSWWANITNGFTYDDNEFRTNQFLHPNNGAAYFNSARGNGLSYWTSAGYATFGAFYWECCGETHPMSINDMVSTSIGGIALGEMMFRLSSEILDNGAHGKTRFFKEFGSFFVDPVRELNRLISGRASAHADNPVDPMDWRPPHRQNLVMLGARVIGQGESISDNTNTYANLGFDHAYGSPFDNTRRKAFDYMDVNIQLSAQDKVPLNVLRISGDLLEKPLGRDAGPNHVLALTQRFDYLNNTAYEFGGQSLGATLYSRFRLSPKLGLSTRADALGLILGAVNSEYAKIADVADRERLREYDYGPGLGAAAQATLTRSGLPLLSLAYRFQWISVSNGSVFSKGQSGQGSDANHYIQAAGARLLIPVFGRVGFGADGTVFLRKSRYSLPAFHDIDQRNPQVRVFLTWNDAW
jgi:uncharacterized protein DUF3943